MLESCHEDEDRELHSSICRRDEHVTQGTSSLPYTASVDCEPVPPFSLILPFLFALPQENSLARDWPQWRGPLATGEAPHADPPVEWSEKRNVRWKVAVFGRAHSSPVVAGSRVYLTTALPVGEPFEPRWSGIEGAHDNVPVTRRHAFHVLALDRATGETLWDRKVHESVPHEGGHETGSLASGSPVTDGEIVAAHFGSHGLYVLSVDGALLWKQDLGRMQSKHGHGEGASPVLHEDHLVVNWDHEGPSFVVNFDRETGEEHWRVERDEVTSWATPIVVEHGGTLQLVVPGSKRLRGYDLETGEVIWECGGLSRNIVASPVAAGGMVFAGSSYEKQTMLAIRLEGARGELTTSENLAWIRRRRTPYVPSPLLYRGALYILNHYQNELSRVLAATGEEPEGPFRLQGVRNVYASPVAAAGRIYLTDLHGATLVFSADDVPEMLASNVLEDEFSASAAIAGDELFLRGHRFLYCIAESTR